MPPEQGLELQVDFDYATISLVHFCKDEAAQDALEAEVRERVGIETHESLLAAAEDELTPRNLLRLGQGFERPHDPRVGRVLERGLAHSSAEVREFTGFALVGRKYAELKGALERAIAVEENARALASLRMASEALG